MKLDTKQLQTITILYVEDDHLVREQTEKFLGKLFKKLYLGKDGQDGLEMYKKYMDEIDIVVSDINMPHMNGFEMINAITSLNKNVPIIVTSAHSDSNNLMKALDLNIDKYITKPIQIKELTVSIVELVTKYKRINNIENLAKNLVQKTTQSDQETDKLQHLLAVTQHENRYLKSVVENMVISFKTDKGGNITEVSNKFKLFFEYEDKVIGEHINFLKCSNCTQDSFQKLMLKAIHTKKTVISNYTFVTNSQRVVEAEVTMTPLYGENSLVNGYIFYLDLL